MTNNGSNFSSVKVGDRLWLRIATFEGWGTVSRVTLDPPPYSSICVSYSSYPNMIWITKNGKEYSHGSQVAFWDEVHIIPPSRPKRLVKKMMKVRPYQYEDNLRLSDSHLNNDYINWCGPIQTIEIEVEE